MISERNCNVFEYFSKYLAPGLFAIPLYKVIFNERPLAQRPSCFHMMNRVPESVFIWPVAPVTK